MSFDLPKSQAAARAIDAITERWLRTGHLQQSETVAALMALHWYTQELEQRLAKLEKDDPRVNKLGDESRGRDEACTTS